MRAAPAALSPGPPQLHEPFAATCQLDRTRIAAPFSATSEDRGPHRSVQEDTWLGPCVVIVCAVTSCAYCFTRPSSFQHTNNATPWFYLIGWASLPLRPEDIAMPLLSVPGPLVELARNPISAVSFPVLLGVSSGLITRTSVNGWYQNIKKPPMEPPRLAFPIAWTYLYGTMGYASYLLAGKLPLPAAKTALALYYFQLGLNMLWTPLFFGAKQPLAALIDIVALTGTVFNLTSVSRKVDAKVFYLLLPYCAWLSFATYLNGGVWWLNFGQDYFKRDVKGKGKGKAGL